MSRLRSRKTWRARWYLGRCSSSTFLQAQHGLSRRQRHRMLRLCLDHACSCEPELPDASASMVNGAFKALLHRVLSAFRTA